MRPLLRRLAFSFIAVKPSKLRYQDVLYVRIVKSCYLHRVHFILIRIANVSEVNTQSKSIGHCTMCVCGSVIKHHVYHAYPVSYSSMYHCDNEPPHDSFGRGHAPSPVTGAATGVKHQCRIVTRPHLRSDRLIVQVGFIQESQRTRESCAR